MALALPGVGRARGLASESKPAEQQLYTLTVPNDARCRPSRRPPDPWRGRVGAGREHAGWKTEIVRKDDRIDVVRFSGGSIAPDFFVTFRLIARNPVEEGELVWRVRQIYAGGE